VAHAGPILALVSSSTSTSEFQRSRSASDASTQGAKASVSAARLWIQGSAELHFGQHLTELALQPPAAVGAAKAAASSEATGRCRHRQLQGNLQGRAALAHSLTWPDPPPELIGKDSRQIQGLPSACPGPDRRSNQFLSRAKECCGGKRHKPALRLSPASGRGQVTEGFEGQARGRSRSDRVPLAQPALGQQRRQFFSSQFSAPAAESLEGFQRCRYGACLGFAREGLQAGGIDAGVGLESWVRAKR